MSAPAGHPFRDYRAFCQARKPFGLGYDPDVLQRLIDGQVTTAEERARFSRPSGKHGGDHTSALDQVDNVNLVKGGNDPDYLTGRCDSLSRNRRYAWGRDAGAGPLTTC